MKQLLLTLAVLIAALAEIRAQSASGYQWGSLPFGGGGFVTGIITSDQEENLIYARTDVGGVYRWIEATKSWKPLRDAITEEDCGLYGTESVALDPNKPSRIYIYCGISYFSNGKTAILRSDDYGETWRTQAVVTDKFSNNGPSSASESGEKLAVDPNRGAYLMCGSRIHGLWKSADFGQHWTRVSQDVFPDSDRISFVHYVASSGTKGTQTPTVFVGVMKKGATNLYVSTDCGKTWKTVDGERTDYMPHRCTEAEGNLYITYTSDVDVATTKGNGAVMKYDMRQNEWTDISPANSSFGEVSVAKDNSNYLVVATLGRGLPIYWYSWDHPSWGDQIYVSKNGGANWTNLSAKNNSHYEENKITWRKHVGLIHWCGSTKIDPFNKNRAFFISGDGIFSTDNLWDAVPDFHMAETGLEETVPLSMCNVEGAPFAVAIGDYDGAFYSDITSYPDRYSLVMGADWDIAIAPYDTQKIIRVGTRAKACISTDGGVTWTMHDIPNTTNYIRYCAISSGGMIMTVTPNGGKPYYSIDGGETWKVLDAAETNAVLRADGAMENIFYSFSSSKLNVFNIDFRTGDVTCTSIPFTGANNTRRPCVVPCRSGDIWITKGDAGITHIENAHLGSTAVVMTDIPVARATCIGVGKSAVEGGYPSLYIWGKPKSTDAIGLYRSDDKGATWTRLNDDQNQFGGPGNAQQVSGDMNKYGRVYMSTVGRGVICGEPNANLAGISQAEVGDLSSVVSISNRGLCLSPGRSACTYSIYTSTGIMVLKGSATTTTLIGNQLPKGLYLLKINEQGQSRTYKFIRP